MVSGFDHSDDQDNDIEKDKADRTIVFDSDTLKVRLAKAETTPPSLVLLVGPRDLIGRQWHLTEDNMIFGRAPGSQVHVDDGSISRSHAKFVVQGAEVSVIDLESTNRTAINGHFVPPLVPLKLKGNDQIKAGNVILKFLEQGSLESVSQEETYQRAQTDPLTGIFNKGALNTRGPELFRKADLSKYPLSVIVFDIDHFKKINDTYLHQAGDYVLKEMARLIHTRLIRAEDFFARFGGEEFVLLLFGSTLRQAVDIAERIRLTIAQHQFAFDGKVMPITVSLGVTAKAPTDSSWEMIFERADKALYASKNSGRNRVTAAS